MTDPIVPPVDPNEPVDPAPVDPVEPDEGDDDDLDPGAVPPAPPNETPEQLKARLAESEEARKKLWARLQREKSKGKPATAAAPAPAPKPAAGDAKPALSRDEAILIAQGLSVEEVEHAQKVATLQ